MVDNYVVYQRYLLHVDRYFLLNMQINHYMQGMLSWVGYYLYIASIRMCNMLHIKYLLIMHLYMEDYLSLMYNALCGSELNVNLFHSTDNYR